MSGAITGDNMVYDREQEASFSHVRLDPREFREKLKKKCNCSEPEFDYMMESLQRAVMEGRAEESVVINAFREGYALGKKDEKRNKQCL